MIDMPAVAIDFEATEANDQAQATEIGICAIEFSDKGILNPRMHPAAVRCKPERDITFGSMAVTGICPEDVADEPSHTEIVQKFMPKGAAYVIGHNVDYDIQVAANAGVDVSQYKAICTLAMARALCPDAEHSLTAMLYKLEYDHARKYAQNAHSADYDVRFCVLILRRFCRDLGITDMQALYEYSELARIPKTFTFGKHMGKSIVEVANSDKGYMNWIIKNNSNAYLIHACRKALENEK